MKPVCLLPDVMPPDHAALYEKVRTLHCAEKREHACVGKLVADRKGVTLSCPLCGDARSTYAKEKTP